MTKEREALTLALEALEAGESGHAEQVIREVLATSPLPVQEPVNMVEHLSAVAGYFYDGPVRNTSVVAACEKAINKISEKEIYKTSIYEAKTQVANNSEVICPACTHQFRAIPEDVQRLMLDAGFEPPFTTPPLLVQPEQEPDCYGYAARLATSIWKQHYQKTSPQWQVFDDLMGVLTQIDNMAAGLISSPLPVQPERLPLTDEQIEPMFHKRSMVGETGRDAWYWYAWGVSDGEAAHNIGAKP